MREPLHTDPDAIREFYERARERANQLAREWVMERLGTSR
jgi:hypothetical protein